MFAWSAKQRTVEAHVFDPDVREILVPGPVQSGKTMSTVYFFLSMGCQELERI